MRRLILALLGLALVGGSGYAVRGLAAAHPLPAQRLLRSLACAGHERWQIKTLTDEQADQVNTSASTSSVAALRTNDSRPAKVSSKVNRIHPVEFRRYRIHASIDQAFREGDGDLHVVIHDRAADNTPAAAATMIAEFPDASCQPQNESSYATQMQNAREAFVALVHRCTGYQGSFGSTVSLNLHATLTGVGFWDIKHGNPQRGRAPNDLELHPILKLTQATCT